MLGYCFTKKAIVSIFLDMCFSSNDCHIEPFWYLGVSASADVNAV